MGDDVGEVEGEERRRSDMGMTPVLPSSERLPREQRVLEVLSEGATEPICNLEDVEDDIELDRFLPSHAVVHLARIGHAVEDHDRPDQQHGFREIAFVRESEVTSPVVGGEVVPCVGEEMRKGGDGSQGEDREGVEERVEADHESKQDGLWKSLGTGAHSRELNAPSLPLLVL